jgi:hypothetical protein
MDPNQRLLLSTWVEIIQSTATGFANSIFSPSIYFEWIPFIENA